MRVVMFKLRGASRTVSDLNVRGVFIFSIRAEFVLYLSSRS